jgi:predicted dehydrogenase
LRIAIIGAGLIGHKRASSLDDSDELVIVCDKDISKAKSLAKKYSAAYTTNSDKIINEEVDVVIISVINKYLKDIAIKMLKSGKNILCEKPLGIDHKESNEILSNAKLSDKVIKTGFNHRFHPAIIEAKNILASGKIGKLLNIRSHYGHGGRPGMEKEWRCSKELCGGGELIDQGVHIIDLCHYFNPHDIIQVYGKNLTSFWNIKVEDNSFFNLEFTNDVLAQCHVSWTNWKNDFLFEIFGSIGYLKIQGLGGSYGLESLEIGYRNLRGGKPNIKKIEYPDEDISWNLEWESFKNSINNNKKIIGNGKDGHFANKIISYIYESNLLNKPISTI